jgi:signal peptidase II
MKFSALPRKARLFWPLAFLLVLSDCATKELVVERLTPQLPHEVVGSFLRLNLHYNPGMALGGDLGAWSRPILIVLACCVLAIIYRLYRRSPDGDWRLALAFGLVCGGAVGNLLDRVRSPRGVVDFIDVGVGPLRFWIFNLADAAIFCGALLLMFLLWRRDASPHLDATGP